jgi:hypothetical protein
VRALVRQLTEAKSPTSAFVTAAWTFFGIGLTSGISIVALYSTDPKTSGWEAILLWCLLAVGLALSVACFIASNLFKREDTAMQANILVELERLEYKAAIENGDLEELPESGEVEEEA